MIKRSILVGTLLAGVLVAGVGTGIAFNEYMSLKIEPIILDAGEAVVEELVYEMQDDELINIANRNCEIVFDESVPSGTVKMTVEYFPETTYISYWVEPYVHQGGESSEEGQRVAFIELYTYDYGADAMFIQCKDEILNGLKNGKLLIPGYDFENGDNSRKVVYLNPADEDRLDKGILGEGNWTRVDIY